MAETAHTTPARIGVVIPALNEEAAVGHVLDAIPRSLSDEKGIIAVIDPIVVVDNGSTDSTMEVAVDHGAQVVAEPRRGYGSACLAGIAAVGDVDIVVFLDADNSDYPEDLPSLVIPILEDGADIVIGSRMRREDARRALLPQARFGNWLATALIMLLSGVRFTDLGPFRAIRRDVLERIDMQDTNFGWTVEMQLKAARRRFRCHEVPVRYRDRIGESKISGTIGGSIRAGWKILYTIAKYARA